MDLLQNILICALAFCCFAGIVVTAHLLRLIHECERRINSIEAMKGKRH